MPHNTTEIDGHQVPLVHVRSPHRGAVPLLLLHGYSNAFIEYVDLLAPLSDPATDGGSPADGFAVVIPSLPGFGFSAPLAAGGWEIAPTTTAPAELMQRLGYERYGVSGGVTGAGIAGWLAAL